MIRKIKEYLEYRANKKIAKKEIVKMAATILPTIREVSNKSVDIIKFVTKLANESNNIKGERFIEMVLHEISTTLQTSDDRLIEILTYMANLQPSDIQKILVHAVVETMPKDNK